MRNEKLLDVFGQIDEQFIIEANPEKTGKEDKKANRNGWIIWATIAASVCLIVGMAVFLSIMQ